jgi:hypothetical protein
MKDPFDLFAEVAGSYIDAGVDPAIIVEALAKATVATHVASFVDNDYKTTVKTLIDDVIDEHLLHINKRN